MTAWVVKKFDRSSTAVKHNCDGGRNVASRCEVTTWVNQPISAAFITSKTLFLRRKFGQCENRISPQGAVKLKLHNSLQDLFNGTVFFEANKDFKYSSVNSISLTRGFRNRK